MATSDPIFCVKLTPDDVPGALLDTQNIGSYSTLQLKRWLECRGLTTTGNKSDLIQRCCVCIDAKHDTDIQITVDGGKWYQKKVENALSAVKDQCGTQSQKPVDLLPVCGWKTFPSGPIPNAFCYGIIYDYIITSAKVCDLDSGKTDTLGSIDFNTSKPMQKGRKYFLSGHVQNMEDTRNKNYYFVKAKVMASYEQNDMYNVSLTIRSLNAAVADASCDCKASAMGRCNHVSALSFAVRRLYHAVWV